MKWIFLSVVIASLPWQAEQQYTEAACILLKQQVEDYQHRLATNSSLYIKSKTHFDTYCQNPVVTKPSGITSLANQPVKTPQKVASHAIEPTLNSKNFSNNFVPVSVQPNSYSKMDSFWILIISFLLFASMVIFYFKKNISIIKGRIVEKYVIKGLTKYLNELNYTIVNDVTLSLEDGGTTQIDHIVVSSYGVFVIETKNMSGWIFGNENQAKWTQAIYRSKHQFQNPLRQNYKHTKALAFALNISHEQIHSVVIFTSNAEFKTQMPSNVGYLEEMLCYIKSFSNETIDHKLKLRIIKLINIIKIKQNRQTNKLHVDYLKERHGGNQIRNNNSNCN